ncbi:hypothetical protein M885DRAFT_626299 [Pelagophyceae sp. CCMP2097]|nr:hypothetical protein M885DRAFT_626299 [Pelagophyceae sp. CCMP2097]
MAHARAPAAQDCLPSPLYASAARVPRRLFAPVARRDAGWGRQAFQALENDDANALRTAAQNGAPHQEDVSIRLGMKAKGGNSFYYDDHRVSAGFDRNPLPPRPGDTLLHVALRHYRSPKVIATLLELGAPREAVNSAGETPKDVNPQLLRRGVEALQGRHAPVEVGAFIPREQYRRPESAVARAAR